MLSTLIGWILSVVLLSLIHQRLKAMEGMIELLAQDMANLAEKSETLQQQHYRQNSAVNNIQHGASPARNGLGITEGL